MTLYTVAARRCERTSGQGTGPGMDSQALGHFTTGREHKQDAAAYKGHPKGSNMGTNTVRCTIGADSHQASSICTDIEMFLVDREARNLSPGTIRFYQEKLAHFSAFAAESGITSVLQVKAHHLRQYLLALKQAHNPGGVLCFYRAVRALINWSETEFEPADWRNPLDKVPAPKVPGQILQPTPTDDIETLLRWCPQDTELGCRDRAILLGLLDTGCRASELRHLNYGDLDPDSGAATVRAGKGGKPRKVFLGKEARKALEAYLNHRGELAPEVPLFATRTGTRLSANGLREVLRRLASRAGIRTPSLHGFRRAFALNCLRSGMDIFALQRLMGHSDLTMVRRYLAQTSEDLARAHLLHSPVDNIFGADSDRPEKTIGGAR